MLRTIIFIALLCAMSPAAAQSVSVQAEHHNMFRVNVRLNNQIDVRALIDTGASSLSLCEAMAKQLRLQLGAGVRLSTANGVIPARRAMVESIRIAGAIEVRNVGAVVKPDDTSCDEILIGMSVLKKLRMTLDGNTLTLAAVSSGDHAVSWLHWMMLSVLWLGCLVSLFVLRKNRSNRLSLRSNRARHLRMPRTFS
jgi:clan AA aspartic protease (TIGR02281 family)